MKAKVGMVRRNMIHFDEDRIVLTAVRDNGQKTLTFDREQINIEWLSDEQAVVSIKKFLKSKKLTHKLWLPVVPLGNILFKTIEIPSINTAEVGQMIGWRLQTSWDVEKNLVWDYKVVLKEGGRSKVLVVGVDKMNLARYWRILKNSGMRFEVFSASCFLVEGLIQSKYGPLAKDYAVIWADDHDYELCVFKGADLIGTKLFGRDNEDRFLLDQIGLYLRICESERQISLSEMFVAAPQKDLDALNAFFKNGLGLPVRPIDIERSEAHV